MMRDLCADFKERILENAKFDPDFFSGWCHKKLTDAPSTFNPLDATTWTKAQYDAICKELGL